MGVRGPKPKQLIDTTWTPELAYAVGLIATDGCLLNDGRHIDLTSADIEQVQTFQRILGLHHIKIGRKTRGPAQGRNYYHIQFGSVLFYQWLVEIGLSPYKSKTLCSVLVPDQYLFDFLRGCFDGDGSIHAYWDARWKSSYMFYVSFASASENFLEWLQHRVYIACGVHGSIVHSHSARVLQLRYAKGDSRVLLQRMYHAECIPYLTRKFTKSKKILSIKQRAIA